MTTDYPVGKALADALVAVRETGAVESLRGLAAVIRTYGTCAPSALDVVADRIEAALAQAPAEGAAAKHWHDLYRKECQLRQDDAARYGQQIVDLEAQAPARNPWQEAVDEARVTAHLGIAADGVTREQATAQLGELIDWHIAVATDPAVNGGFKLVPVAQAPAASQSSSPPSQETPTMTDLIELAKQQAAEIARAGHNGWGNTMLELAAALEAARAERDVIVAEAVKYADKSGRLEAKVERLAEAGRRVTAAFRAHGAAPSFTRQAERWRLECEAAMLSLADDLRDHEQEVGDAQS